MKDMEIKTENRYEYRKTQEKRKQIWAKNWSCIKILLMVL